MSFTDTLNAIPDQVLDMIETTQEMILATASSFAQTASSYTPASLPFAPQLPDATAATDNAFSFAEKLLASQKDFSVKLIETYLPAKPARKVSAKA